MANPRVFAGFITYGGLTARYLPDFLASWHKQTYVPVRLMVWDNSENSKNLNAEYLEKHCPDLPVRRGQGNLGFAAAYNQLIKEAIDEEADYFIVTNPDTFWDANAVDYLVRAMDGDSNLGSAGPLVMRWDFEARRMTNVIDTCGIRFSSGLHFFDAGQGCSADIESVPDVLGPSGAAAIYRISALKAIAQAGQYFDERFFMYKEDADLSYRLNLAGFTSICVSQARVWHDRTAAGGGEGSFRIALNRRNKSKKTKIWSFRGQQLIFRKFWHTQSWRSRFSIIWYEFKALVFVLVFERYLLKEFSILWTAEKIK
jgi:GT2 family glycosyltransferase